MSHPWTNHDMCAILTLQGWAGIVGSRMIAMNSLNSVAMANRALPYNHHLSSPLPPPPPLYQDDNFVKLFSSNMHDQIQAMVMQTVCLCSPFDRPRLTAEVSRN